MQQNILVTGGAGYIGSHVCKALHQQKYVPITFDNLSSGNKDAVKWGPLYEGDICNTEQLDQCIRKYQPVAVIHLAALIHVEESTKNPKDYYECNVIGSTKVLNTCLKHNIENVIFSSTAAVYGAPETRLIDETHSLNPVNPYGQTKLIIEKTLHSYSRAYPLNYISLRYFNAAGAALDSAIGSAYHENKHIIPILMQVAGKEFSNFHIYGTDYDTKDGSAIRDYIHVMDIAVAHVKALNYLIENKQSLELNIGSESGFSVKEIVTATENMTKEKIPIVYDKRRLGDPPILVANSKKAKKYLDWKPQHSDIETIISTAWTWYKKQKKYGIVDAFKHD